MGKKSAYMLPVAAQEVGRPPPSKDGEPLWEDSKQSEGHRRGLL